MTLFLQIATIHRLELTEYMTDADVVHMIQTSRIIAKYVISGATLHRVFVIKSLQDLCSLKSFTCRWQLHVMCMHLMIDFKIGETLLDDNDRSLLPSSLIRLSIGPAIPSTHQMATNISPSHDVDLFAVSLDNPIHDNDCCPNSNGCVFDPLFERTGVGFCQSAPRIRQLLVSKKQPMRLPPLIPGVLPENVQYLHLNGYRHADTYNYDLPLGTLPERLRFLRLSLWHWPHASIGASLLPRGLTHLMMSQAPMIQPGDLPESLLELRIENGFDKIELGALPQSLRYLDVNQNPALSRRNIGILPPSLVACRLANTWFEGAQNLPRTLRYFDLMSCDARQFNLNLADLPEDLRLLTLPALPHPISRHMLPSSLQYLQFHSQFNQPVISLPPLVGLAFGRNFNSTLPEEGMPNSLRWLIIPKHYQESLTVSDSCNVLFRHT